MVSGILDLRDHRDQVMADEVILIKNLLNKKACTLENSKFDRRKGPVYRSGTYMQRGLLGDLETFM